MPKFYTLPPLNIPYPYILVNAHRPEEGLWYLVRHRRFVESLIIDSGVELFRHKSLKDYPGGFRGWIERRLLPLYRRVSSIVGFEVEVLVTIPDYPDDYAPGGLWEGEWRTNIERTLDSVDYAINMHPEIPWIIPVQGHYEKPESIIDSLEELNAIGALKWAKQHSRYIALANLCTSRKCTTIAKTVKLAKCWLNQHGYSSLRVHVFGPAANCVRKIASLISSWDSLAWTKPREPGGSSCWNQAERAYLFITWIHKYADLIELPPHPKTMQKRTAAKLSPQI